MRSVPLHRSLVLLTALWLVGCGGNAPAPDGKSEGSTGKTPSPATSLPEMYTFPVGDIIPTLDPAMVTDSLSAGVINQLFDGLVKIDPDGQLVPALATSWTVDPAGLVYTFVLQPGVKFHNGRELTADDVEFSFNRVLNPQTQSPKTLFLDPIKGAADVMSGKAPSASGIVVRDPLTIEITLDRPNALFPWYLAQSTTVIVPREATENMAKAFSNNPVGTGPFRMAEGTYNPAEGVTLEAYPDYFQGAPKLKGIKYVVEKEAKKRFEGFKRGTYTHTDIPAEEIEGVLADPKLAAMMIEKPTLDMYNIAFNCDKEPLKGNPTLRQALNYAVDKEFIANTLLKQTRTISTSYLPNNFPGYTAPHGAYPYNPEKAAELLKQAGYPGGEGLPSMTLWCNNDETHSQIMQAVQGDFAKLGVKTELRTLDWGSFLEAMDQGQHHIGQATWLMDYPDPDNILYVLFHSKNKGPAGNQAFYGNPQVDKLVEEAQVIADQAQRMALYQQAEQIIYDDAPWILLLNRKCMILKQPYVQGLHLTRLDRAPQIPGVDLETVSFVQP
ncbi:MAG: Heme-binding protein A [bacterium]|nr:Heme-binding protein A [bacterium]